MKTGFYNKYYDLIFALMIIGVAILDIIYKNTKANKAIFIIAIAIAFLLSFIEKINIKNKKITTIIKLTIRILATVVVISLTLRLLI